MARTLGVLLAGGRGRRLGGAQPKALALLAGRTLLDRQLATLSAVCDDIVVCVPHDLELPVPASMRAEDPPGMAGPLAGLVAGLSSRPFARALVLGVDLPGASAAALAALERSLAGGLAAIAGHAGRVQPLLGAYAPAARGPLCARLAAGERALVPAVMALDPRIVPADSLGEPEWLLFNLNLPEDARLAERHLAAGDAA